MLTVFNSISAAARNGRGTPVSSARQMLLALVCLVAFTFQGYVGQTHIHSSLENAVSVTAAKLPVPSQKQAPADDPVRCPQCQVASLTGSAVPPDVLVFVLPSQSFLGGFFAIPALLGESIVSHAWDSRGPPQH